MKTATGYAAQFWASVADCLVRFHQFDPAAAMQEAHSLRDDLARTARSAADRDMIFHEEPWYIACDLAGKEGQALRPTDWPAYEKILTAHKLAPRRKQARV